MLIAIAMLVLVRESGADRAAARAYGSLRTALRAVGRDRNLVLVYLSGVLGGGGRGLGVLNVFVPLYLSLVLHLDAGTVALMYTALVVLQRARPDRRRLAVRPVRPQAAHPRRVHRRRRALVGFVLAGSNETLLVDRDPAAGHLQLRREPAAPGAACRTFAAGAARRLVLGVLHARLRRRLAVGRAVRLGDRHVRRGCGPADHLPADGRRVPGGGLTVLLPIRPCRRRGH